MKSLILIITIAFFGLSIVGQTAVNLGAELTPVAKQIKASDTTLYGTVKRFAILQWQDDHFMVVSEINNQIDYMVGCYKLLEAKDFDQKIWDKAMSAWTIKHNGEILVDWMMVFQEYVAQLNSKNAY